MTVIKEEEGQAALNNESEPLNNKSVRLPTTTSAAKFRQYLASIIVNLSSFCYGSIMAWPSPTLPLLKTDATPLGSGPMSEEEASWVGSLICLGALITTPLYGILQDRWGRKVAGYLVATLYVISWVLILLADNTVLILVSRFVAGTGSSGTLVLCSSYVSEMAQDDIRGTLGSFLLFFINAGILFTYVLGSYVPYTALNLAGLALPLFFAASFFFLPESPVFLISKDRRQDALQSLRWFRVGISDQVIEEEFQKISERNKENSPSGDDGKKVSFREIFSSPATKKGFIISVFLCANQQFSGIFAILSFTVSIFQESGSSMSANLATILVGAVQFLGSYFGTLLIDRAGRRILMIASNGVVSTSLGILSGYFFLKQLGINMSRYGWVPVTCLCGHIFFFAVGLGPVPYVVVSEIMAPRVQSLAITVSVCTIWGLAFLLTKTFVNIQGLLGVHGVYGIFSTACTVGTLFATYYMVETKNKSLEVILKELGGDGKRQGKDSESSNSEEDTTAV